MSDEKRLAEIEARRVDASYESESAGKPDNIEVLVYRDIPWLLARIRALEAQAARDKARPWWRRQRR